MQRQMPASFSQPQRMSANKLGIFLPENMLKPVERGNPQRSFNDQDEYEITAENQATLSLAASIRVWATKVEVLTGLLWPKMKLREGVRRITGTRFEYNPMPTTSVPKRGTVRLMSKSISAFSLAISQKGIGSRFEGSALRSPMGPTLLALETEAYAESISIGMAINTAINSINAAFRQPYMREGIDYTHTRLQQLQQEMRLWGIAGRDHGRLALVLDEILTEYPQLDTALVPNKWSNILVEQKATSISYRDTYLYTMDADGGNDLLELLSPDKVLTLTQLAGGRLNVHEMPTFRIGKQRSWQPLAVTNTIGEIYHMFPENNPDKPNHYNPNSLNIYLYDEQNDILAKQRWVDVLDDLAIWNPEVRGMSYSDTNLGYHPKLVTHVASLNNNPQAKAEAKAQGRHRQVYPVSFDAKTEKFFLPVYYGNLDHRRFGNTREFDRIINSVMSSANFAGSALHEMQGDIALLKQLQNSIQNEVYNAEFWAEIVRLNLERSVSYDGAGRPYFAGQATPAHRAADHGVQPIREWVTNRYGSLDAPADTRVLGMPAGYFNAAGLQTIANTPGHPLADQCERSYKFLLVCAEVMQKVFTTSGVFSEIEMPINMPQYDIVQLVMNVCFGPTAPIFLAAPMGMSKRTVANARGARSAEVPFGEDLPSNVIVAGDTSTAEIVAALEHAGRASTGSSRQGYLQMGDGGSVLWRSSTGVVMKLSQKIFTNLIASPSKGEEVVSVKAFIDTLLGNNNGLKIISTLPTEDRAAIYNKLYALLSEKNDKKNRLALIILDRLAAAAALNDTEKAVFVAKLLNKSGGTTDRTLIAELNKSSDYPPNFADSLAAKYDRLGTTPVPANLDRFALTFRTLLNGLAAGNASMAQSVADFDPNNYYLGENTNFSSTMKNWLTAAEAAGVEESTVDQVRQAWTVIVASSTGVGFDTSAAGAETIPGLQLQQGSVLDVATATKYRTPLTMSWALLRTLVNAEVPWIAPGDHKQRFNSALNIPRGIVPQEMWDLPQYAYSRGGHVPINQNWADMPIFSRVAVGVGAYNNRAAASSSISSAGPVGRLQEESYGRLPAVADDGLNRAHLPPATRAALEGDMVKNMTFAMGRTQQNFVLRLAAICLLMTPHYHLETIKELHTVGVRPLHGISLWRPRSTHEMGWLLLAKAGIESGANFYNGMHFGWAHDGNTDEYQTRLVLTTDAHVLKPDNHVLVPNIQCRVYLGGHNNLRARSQEELITGELFSAPSIMATMVETDWHEDLSYPVSLKNAVPGILDVTRVASVSDMPRQFFPESGYYADIVYNKLYGEHGRLEKYSPFSEHTVKNLHFHSAAKENHVAMRGYHIRFDYHHGIYCMEVVGNGHRAEVALNRPKAAAYLNGITTKLDAVPLAVHLGLS